MPRGGGSDLPELSDGLHLCRESGYLFLSILPRGGGSDLPELSDGLHLCREKLVKENQGEFPGAKPDPKLQQCGKFHSGAAGGAAAQGPRAGAGKLQPCFS